MKTKVWKRVAALAMCATLWLGAFGCSPAKDPSQTPQEPQGPSSGQKVSGRTAYAHSERYSLWADGDTGEVWISDREDTVLWSTFAVLGEGMYDIATEERRNAVILVYAVDKYNNTNMASSYTHSVQEGGLTLSPVSNGVTLYFDFPGETEKYTVPVQFTLQNDRLQVEVLFDRIRTYGDVEINTVDLMPYFGAATKEDEGYMLVPDGSGALISFSDVKQAADVYSQPVYGKDPVLTTERQLEFPEDARLPVMGLSRNGKGFVAYVEQGACETTVNAAQPGKISIFSHLHFSFTYIQRDRYTLADKDLNAQTVFVNADVASTVNPVVTYLFLDESADYIAMANRLREYLIETEGYTRTETADPTLFLEMFGGALQEKNLLGIPYHTLQVATTFADAKDILARLRGQVSADIQTVLYGFQKKGMYHNAYDWTFDKAFGGTEGFDALCAYAAENRITVRPALEFQMLYSGRVGNAARRISGDYITEGLRQPHTGIVDEDIEWYRLSPVKAAQTAKDFLANTARPSGSGIFLPEYGDTVYADYNKNDPLTRSEALQHVLSVLQAANGNAVVNGGNLYAVTQSSAVLGAPETASGYVLESEHVPFYSILLHGFNSFSGAPINEAKNPKESFLHCIANGYSLTFRLTSESPYVLQKTDMNYLLSTQFSAWEQDIVQMTKRLQELNGLNDRFITNYRTEGDVTVTTYDNGVQVYVNFGTQEATVDGYPISAQDFLCIR